MGQLQSACDTKPPQGYHARSTGSLEVHVLQKNCESQRRVLSEVLVPLATCMGPQFCPRGTPARTIGEPAMELEE